MKSKFSILGKAFLLLIVFGFFMPIGCNQNGVELADNLMNFNQFFSAIALILIPAVALISIIITVIFLVRKKREPAVVSWCTLVAIVISTLCFLFGGNLRFDGFEPQTGAFLIAIGFVGSLVFQILSAISRKKSE